MVPDYVNRFGRRGGRGIRPWLLIPKVLAVALYFGGMGSAATLWFLGCANADMPMGRRLWTLNLIGRLLSRLVVPSLLSAIGLGIALTMQHPRILLRMRWLIAKLALLAVFVPSAHMFMSSRMAILRAAWNTGIDDSFTAMQFSLGLAASLVASAAIVTLGRLKPRLGQNPAKQ